MAHIKYGSKVLSGVTTAPGYYPVAKQVGEFVNAQSRRTNIVAVIGPDAGMGAPACFIPALNEMHLNTTTVKVGDPEHVDFNDALWCLEHAAAVGASAHEAAHARHTFFDPKDLIENYGATAKIVDVITTLEEPRIEANSLREHPSNKPYLRGCAMDIIVRDFKIPDTRYGAAAAAGLLLARVDAGILSRAEVRTHRKNITAVLGEDTLDALEPLWQRFLLLRDTDYAGQVMVAQEWLAVLGEDPEDASGRVGESMMGEPLPGEGTGSGSGSEGEHEGEAPEGFGESISGKAREASVKMDGEVNKAAGEERRERKRAEAAADADRHKEGKREHEKSGKGSRHGFSPDGFHHHVGDRKPTNDERLAARTLAKALEKIQYHDRIVRKTKSAVPPGRLRGRVAVEGAAARAKGLVYEGEPWQGKRRVRVDSTPLKLGIIGDMSGSMSDAMQALASTLWVASTAGSHIDADVACVHMGTTASLVLPKGYREKNVRIFNPNAGHEAFRASALTLDHELNLLDGRGARLLVIASDGCFVNGPDEDYARAFIPLAMRKGVAVIFLDFTHDMSYGSYGARVVDCAEQVDSWNVRVHSPAKVAGLVGQACIEELRRVDRAA